MVAGIAPPLGIALRADGLSAVMLVTSALILPAAGLFARAGFATPPGGGESRKALTFWIMLQAISAALAIIFVSGDLFNLYVALELLTFAAVPLACVDGRAETYAAALRYLLFALFGSIFYLLGAALLYGAFGTLDIAASRRANPADAGRHHRGGADDRWASGQDGALPAAPLAAASPRQRSRRRRAPCSPASWSRARSSWWCGCGSSSCPRCRRSASTRSSGRSGRRRSVFGSVMALRQPRLKLLIAYSTIAQIGYLFLIFPLGAGTHAWTTDGWNGGLMQVLAHAFAKSSMFLAAGLLYESLGHDRDREILRRGARHADDLLRRSASAACR